MPYGDVHILYVNFLNDAIAEKERAEEEKKKAVQADKNNNSMEASEAHQNLQITEDVIEEIQDEFNP